MSSFDLSSLGPNMRLVDEMYRRFREDPQSVAPAWREFFADFEPGSENGETPASASPGGGGVPLRGAAARVAQNMEASLAVPTATSVRFVPAKLLEENRRVVNRFLEGSRGGKVSFTHLIGWAVVTALGAVPAMKRSYVLAADAPAVATAEAVNLGLAVDVHRPDGSRILVVPNIKGATDLDFAGFWTEYEDVIHRVRANRLSPDDFAGTTVTLSNPGTIGTQLSVPRLMPGQGAIVAVGRVDYPSEYQAADPATLAELGVGKVIGVTSTYDHRVIQGAESGEFLATIESLLLGGDGFYDDVFASLGVPYEPVRWIPDHRAPAATAGAVEPEKAAGVLRLINMYRVRGHLLADLNPLGSGVLSHPELDPAFQGLTVWDLDRRFFVDDLPGGKTRTLRDVLDLLRDAYCRTVGIEYMHIQDHEEKRWIQERVEAVDRELPAVDKRWLLERLNAAEVFERFLHTKYLGHKRFSLEGAESLIPMLDAVLGDAVEAGMQRVVMGMAHRGRLNVLANIVGKSYGRIFREFEGSIDPTTTHGSGDVKYHLGAGGEFTARSGGTLAVELASNPSHLEAVDPVVEGMARAHQGILDDPDGHAVLPLLIHGDAAFAGEGVVAETFGMSRLPGYATGGTVHVVVDNQLGFTTPGIRGRSSRYATDIAKMVQAPILHVNGDDPEACVWAARLAFAHRQAFHRDVVIDLLCYRRYGHNEADDPSYTQPAMYAAIDRHRSVRKLYMEKLVNRGDITVEEAEAALEDYRTRLEQAFDETTESAPPVAPVDEAPPRPGEPAAAIQTAVERGTLERIERAVTTWPERFTPHPKLARQLERRRDLLQLGAVDWSMAEAFAFGSLVMEGIPVRLAGQDSRRGTFSQRHDVLVDALTEDKWYPLANLATDQASFLVYDSPLNEFAAMGFEYGYSVVRKDALILWEAQFGDFVNEAEVIVDQFVVAAEDKWSQTSGLVLLLPHGFEGQGPEHSSARLERFLTLAAQDNIRVAVPSTPAQYFHLLRRQARDPVAKPLIVFTPKWLLRLPAARSTAGAFTEGRFRELLPDAAVAGREATVRSAILCSGKIFYELDALRRERGIEHVALLRLEQLYPFPAGQILDALQALPGLAEIRWVQEEPENMGGYAFVHRLLHGRLPDGVRLAHASRPERASPATGSATMHEREQRELLDRAFDGL